MLIFRVWQQSRFIDILISRGLITKNIRGKRTLYSAENPKQFLADAKRKHDAIQKALPEMDVLYKHISSKSAVQSFEGKQGVRLLYREILSTTKPVYSIFAADRYWSVFNEKDGKRFLEDIYQSGGELRDLVENSPSGEKYIHLQRANKVGRSKLLPKGFSFSSDIIISGNKAAFISLRNLSGVLIENRDIAELQRKMFLWIWKGV